MDIHKDCAFENVSSLILDWGHSGLCSVSFLLGQSKMPPSQLRQGGIHRDWGHSQMFTVSFQTGRICNCPKSHFRLAAFRDEGAFANAPHFRLAHLRISPVSGHSGAIQRLGSFTETSKCHLSPEFSQRQGAFKNSPVSFSFSTLFFFFWSILLLYLC